VPTPENGSLVKWDGDGTLAAGPFALMRVGLLIDGQPTYEQWEAAGKMLAHMSGAVHWWVGDWLNYGEGQFPDQYTQAADLTGLHYQTLRDAKWVAGAIPVSRRRDKLSFAHHKEVAALAPQAQDAFLEHAEAEGWNRSDLRDRVKEVKVPDQQPPAFDSAAEAEAIRGWLAERRAAWPEDWRGRFVAVVRTELERLEVETAAAGGEPAGVTA
jgi:hypothetical protein